MRSLSLLALLIPFGLAAQPQPKPKTYRLPATDLKQPIIWGSEVDLPDGTRLGFGGQDQHGDDGAARTRLKVDGKWMSLTEELRKAHPDQAAANDLRTIAAIMKFHAAAARSAYLDGDPERAREFVMRYELGHGLVKLDLRLWAKGNEKAVARVADRLKTIDDTPVVELTPSTVARLAATERALREAADLLDAEPSPRALSPLVVEPKTGLVVLFGGDHLDYLTADTWAYDPKAKRWTQRFPESAPPPRANHALKANGDGTVTLTGGYTYSNSTDYLGGQYQDHGDGPWTYDVAANKWTGTGPAGSPTARTYRTGPYDPAYFLGGDKPDAAAFQKRLADLPANAWTATKPPLLPQLNRDWGTAILDPDRDLILRWSGGHSAHGGTDVLHYHLASNRWELPCPVEFPLGQLYANTDYPDGWNFNRRPWVTGHTYQNYGYEPFSKSMLFLGRHRHAYRYDPDVADWADRAEKPAGMVYDSCFYTLTTTTTPHGLVCWTQAGRLFHLPAKDAAWQEVKLDGKLPGAVVDNSTLTWDAKRERLLFIVKPYGREPFRGEVWSVDWKTKAATALNPKGKAGVAELPYLCQWRYHPEADLVVAGAWLDPAPDKPRRMAAYDPASNRWVSLAVGGDDPFGKTGRNVSLGMVYDPKRKLFWAVDAKSQVFALRLDAATADVTGLGD